MDTQTDANPVAEALIADQALVDAAEAPAPVEAEAASAPEPVVATCKLFVAFVYISPETKQERHGRTFINGMVDLFTQSQVEQAETMILSSYAGKMESVTIVNWMRLVA